MRGVVLLLAATVASLTFAGSAIAADRVAPRIVKAAMQDADRDGKADRVVLTYSERVRHALDRDGRYPFSISGYRTKQVGSAVGSTLVVFLRERASKDGTATPSIRYTRTLADPVRDVAGNQARAQTFAGTFPVLAVFVKPSGSDSAAGSHAAPKRTIPAGIERAKAIGADVYVAAGTYAGQIQLADGVSVFGGFDANFRRDAPVAKRLTTIRGVYSGATGRFVAVVASQLAMPTTIADFTILGPDATDPSFGGENAYAMIIADTPAGVLTVSRNVIRAGDGGDGVDGLGGANAATLPATDSMNGRSGGPAAEYAVACDPASHGLGGAAGTNAASGGRNPNGGTGGHGGEMDTSCGWWGGCDNCNATAGDAGQSAPSSASGFGIGGAGGAGISTCGPGQRGLDGLISNGSGGTGGAGGALFPDGIWRANEGAFGGVGQNGGGGGGGGGSGGCDVGVDSYGAGGGAGGAGGARALSGGRGGSGGGSSFAIYLYDASPTIVGNAIFSGDGGAGGDGGTGGQGQSGGLGGAGGLPVGDSRSGGAGGNGGHGGHGGGGGGGAGGASYGIFLAGGTPTMRSNVITPGSGGAGGAGGPSAPGAPAAERDGNPGSPGVRGAAGPLLCFGPC